MLRKEAIGLAAKSFPYFLNHMDRNYNMMWFHEYIARMCEQLVIGMLPTDRLMIFVPPQHGKSEIVSRKLPAWLLGINPRLKIVGSSYSAPLAQQFSRSIQRLMDSPEYAEVFPDTYLSRSNIAAFTIKGYLRNVDFFETVGYGGFYKAVGVGGSLTGTPVDIGIIDDPVKDAMEAYSQVYRDRVWDWYTSVFLTRLHNQSKQIFIMTRWHQDDLAGRLLDSEPEKWTVVNLPAIKENSSNPNDSRKIGEALWEEKHSLARLKEIAERSPIVFESLYQQNPTPHEGLMYEQGFREYEAIPNERRQIKAYCDTADTGSDYLCSIVYAETASADYVLDVLYTQKSMEYTEPKTAEQYTKYQVQRAVIESNNGGRSFARAVEQQCRSLGNNRTLFTWFTQTKNKEVRIFTQSSEVQNLIYMPVGWQRMWPDFHRAITGYRRTGRNDHDDAPDALTGIVEHRDGGSRANEYALRNLIRR